MLSSFLRFPAISIAVGLLAICAQGQSFQINTTDIPQGLPFNNHFTEQVDFADVDLDGDWDAGFAQGQNLVQNRLLINMGGAQGGTTGFFDDQTHARMPNHADLGRDIEFVDFDSDGDPDVYNANSSYFTSLGPRTSRWWTNQGGLQAASIGFFVDDTDTRWVDLAGPSSSLAALDVLGVGFRSYCKDGDFADIDNDGDLDLVHSSYGTASGILNGQVPTRIFLNDGLGFFSEFNPSGFKLAGTTIVNGNPGLWCDGTQQHNTSDTTGASCDIATSGVDVDLGDIDGDFDLDILLGAVNEVPRMFANRLEGSSLAPFAGGGLGFRDVTAAVYPPGYASGSLAHWDQEFADLEGDGDLDIWGAGWLSSLTDITLRNVGDGTYTDVTTVPSSFDDFNEVDLIDYDNDGDLDSITCNFSGSADLFRNTQDGGTDYAFVGASSELPFISSGGIDIETCDVDSDGDYDAFHVRSGVNAYVENITGTPDTHAPYIPNVEQAPDRVAGPAATVVRAHVYDNAPYYITWYNDTSVEVTVDGGAPTTYPATSSGGQVFRAEIPGNLAGTICYRFISADEYGNQGQSAQSCYDATDGCVFSNFCSSTPNSTGSAAVMSFNQDCVVANNNLVLTAGPMPNEFGIFFYSLGQVNGGAGLPFGNGLLCVGGGQPIQRLDTEIAVGNVLTHAVDFDNPPSASGTVTPGSTWNFQAWFRDPAGGGAFFDLSDGLTITFQ